MRVAKDDVEGNSIVDAAWNTGLAGKRKCSVNCASMHAIVGITKAVAKEEASTGIRVKAIATVSNISSAPRIFLFRWRTLGGQSARNGPSRLVPCSTCLLTVPVPCCYSFLFRSEPGYGLQAT
jgi:hypothetical protein